MPLLETTPKADIINYYINAPDKFDAESRLQLVYQGILEQMKLWATTPEGNLHEAARKLFQIKLMEVYTSPVMQNLLEKELQNFPLQHFFPQGYIISLFPATLAEPPSSLIVDSQPLPPNLSFQNTPGQEGHSCFCDSVAVAMFLASQRYDRIFLDFPQADKFDLKRIELSDNEIWYKGIKTPTILNTCEDSVISVSILNVLKEIMEGMRKGIGNEKLTPLMKSLRKTLENSCGGQESTEQGDPDQFYYTLLNIAGASGFIPLFSSTNIWEFDSKEFPSVPPLYEIEVMAGSIRIEIPRKGNTELQSMIARKFRPIDKGSELRTAGRWNDFFLKYGVLLSFDYMMTPRVSEHIVLLYAPSTFALNIQRNVPTGEGEGEPIKTKQRVKFPPNFEIKIPTIIHPGLRYQIFAIACHRGTSGRGHYVLYFNYEKDNQWYFYNDDEKTLSKRVNGLSKDDITEIETLGTLFWVTRIGK